jgi:hypothetical protein
MCTHLLQVHMQLFPHLTGARLDTISHVLRVCPRLTSDAGGTLCPLHR